MPDERAEPVEESRIEDLPLEPMSNEEQATVKGGGSSSIAYVQAVTTTSAAQKTD